MKIIMKKIGLGVLAILCLGVVIFISTKNKNDADAADFLPDTILVYAEQLEFSKMFQQFQGSRLGKVISELNYDSIAAGLGESGEVVRSFNTLRKDVVEIFENPAFDVLLGKEFSVAMFPADSFTDSVADQPLKERILLIARPRHNVKILQFLVPLFSDDIQQTAVQYGKYTINRYQIDDEVTVATTMVDGLLLAGFSERLVRTSLDVYDTKENTLRNTEDFIRLRQDFQGAQLFAYYSLPALHKYAELFSQSLETEEQLEFNALLQEWRGWRGGAYGAWHEEGLVRDKIKILFDQNVDSTLARLYRVEPSINHTLDLVPTDALVYYWTNRLNISLLWETYSSSIIAKQPHAFDLLRRELRDSVGIGIEELLDMINKDFAVILQDIDEEGLPIPKFATAIQLKEPDQFLAIFNKLLTDSEIPLSHKKINEYDITYWGVAPQSGLQPAFTLIDDYLLVANSIDLVRQIITTKEDSSQSLFNGAIAKEITEGFTGKTNSSAYVRVDRLADSLKTIATWGADMAILQGPKVANEADIIIGQLVLPLLEGLTMYTHMGSKSSFTKDAITIESTTIVAQ